MNSHNVSIRVGMGGALGGTESKPSGENGGDTAFGDLIAYGGGGAGGVFYAGKDAKTHTNGSRNCQQCQRNVGTRTRNKVSIYHSCCSPN